MREIKKVIISDGDITEEQYISDFSNVDKVSIDTETTGLDPLEDKLCIIQIYNGVNMYIIKYSEEKEYKNLINIITNENIIKVFHHASFDVRFLIKNLKINFINNTVCTKIAYKVINGINKSSSLKVLVKEYLDITMDKSLQTSNWMSENLTKKQIEYAVADAYYLYYLWEKIKIDLKNNNDFWNISEQCFKYIPINAYLCNKGINNIFEY